MSQMLPINDFKWVQGTSQFDKIFINILNEESNDGTFLEADIQYLENLRNLHNDLTFSSERKSRKACG